MIIFQRLITFDRVAPQDMVPWAMEVTEHVNATADIDIALWQGTAGVPLGSMGWSGVFPSITALEVAADALAADAAYLDLTAKAMEWVSTPGEDSLFRIQHAAGGEYVRPHVGAYAESTFGVPAPSKMAAAGAFGVEIADLHAELTHSSVLFCTAEYRQFGELAWFALYEDAAALDHGTEQIAKDEQYRAELDMAGPLFQPGSTQRMLARRIM